MTELPANAKNRALRNLHRAFPPRHAVGDILESCLGHVGILCGTALFAAVVLVPEQALSACSPSGRSLPSNTSVTCTGADTEGSRASTGTTNVTISVEAGGTVTRNQNDPQRVLSVYSSSQITNDGSLSSNGNSAAGMAARSDGNTLINNGAITTSGPFGIGLYIEGGNGTVAVNNGAISTRGGSGYGFGIESGTGNSVTNNGTIVTSGQDADGFHILGTGNEAINNGEINLSGIESDGMDAIGSGHRLTNTGTITTNPPPASNQDSDGMAVDGDNNVLINSGTVTVNGLDSNGFDIEGNNNEATNSGTLTALGPNGAAIYVNGTGNSVANSGTVEAQGATGNGAVINSVSGESNALINTTTGTITSQQTIAVLGFSGNETIDNAGSIISGVGPAIDLGDGSDSVIMRDGSLRGTGAVVVNLGAGDDVLIMSGGAIEGSVDQGDGADRAEMHGGTITGNLQQGAGMDDFQMTGGQIGSLNQGDGRDTFFMSGGHIVGAVEDSGYAVMTGGRIGRVDMKLDKNYFNMSGGVIDRNLVTGFDDDTIIISNGTIGGNISVSGGADSVTITGGIVAGNVMLSVGSDQFTWDGGGVVNGTIDLGGDDDVAVFANLSDPNIGATPRISGGSGTDSLTFDNVATGAVNRFDSWETASLTNNTRLIFDSAFILGDADTGTGTLAIDATSTILGGSAQSSIVPFGAGQLVNVINAGRIDLTDNGSSTTDSLAITGNYSGQNGMLLLDTVLGGDASPSDKLVIENGLASGNTAIQVNNVGGAGASTTADGIMVVQALNGAATTSDAFALNERAAAGAYEYYLFKGGISANTAENWYLRSTIVPGVNPAPGPKPVLPPAEGVTPPSPGATPVEGNLIPLYREEVPVYSALPPVAHHLALSTLGTFHERRGEQDLLESAGYLPASWARVFGQDVDMRWKGTVAPGLDGQLYGIQAGLDLLGRETNGGHFDRFGVFFGYARAAGDITGQALGWNDLAVGDLETTGTSFGGYWTHIGPQGWYLDAVLMGTWLDGNASSNASQGIDLGGHGVTASLEGGYPVALGGNWTLEPQAQLIWRKMSLDDRYDRYSSVSFDSDNTWTGRIGIRLQGTQETSIGKLRPYLKTNLWRNFSSDQTVSFGGDPIVTDLKGTSLEVGGGLTLDVTEKASLFATADFTTNLGGEKTRIWEGSVGVNIKW